MPVKTFSEIYRGFFFQMYVFPSGVFSICRVRGNGPIVKQRFCLSDSRFSCVHFRSSKQSVRWTKMRWLTDSTSYSAWLRRSPTTTTSRSKTTEVARRPCISCVSLSLAFFSRSTFSPFPPFAEMRSKHNQMEPCATLSEAAGALELSRTQMHTCPAGYINCGGVSVRLYMYLRGPAD